MVSLDCDYPKHCIIVCRKHLKKANDLEKIGQCKTVVDAFRSGSAVINFTQETNIKINFAFSRPETSHHDSYEDIDASENIEVGLNQMTGSPIASERIPLGATRQRRNSMKFLVRQASSLNTQKTPEGTMQLTYWF